MRAALVAVAAAAAACTPAHPIFECDDWSDCGPGGACEPQSGACSFPDDECATGRRYGELSRSPFGGACVEALPEAPGGAVCVTSDTCADYRECAGNRCVSTLALDGGAELFVARCAFSIVPGKPLQYMGKFAIESLGAALEFNAEVILFRRYACPPPQAAIEFPCPAECMTTPRPMYCEGPSAVAEFAAGSNHLCYTNGRVHCLGENNRLQLGDGSVQPPQTGELLRTYDRLAAGRDHTCGALEIIAGVDCWGSNEHGQLSESVGPAPTATPVPRAVFGGTNSVDFLAVSDTFSCVASNSDVECWGTMPWPAGLVPGLGGGDIEDFDVGTEHGCVIKEGRAMCWGQNGAGQLDGTPGATITSAIHVMPERRFARVVTGRAHTCAVTVEGEVWCWGDNTDGQLDGVPSAIHGPVRMLVDEAPVVLATTADIEAFRGVDGITAGADITCAILADDRVRCWGKGARDEPRFCQRTL